VDNVRTFRLVLGRKAFGLAWIPHVFAASLCLQGMECSSSPTSGTVFSQVKVFFASLVLTKLDITRFSCVGLHVIVSVMTSCLCRVQASLETTWYAALRESAT
jgi:hypothetical protein